MMLLGLVLMALGCIDNGDIKEESTIPENGSFENPADAEREAVILEFMDGSTCQVSVNKFVRGTLANNEIAQENMFNPEPPGGYEYLLVKMQVAYIAGNGPITMSNFNFKAFCEGVECDSTWIVLPSTYKEFTTGEVMPGGIKDGWLVYIVPKNKEVIISYQPTSVNSNDAAYLSIGTALYKNS